MQTTDVRDLRASRAVNTLAASLLASTRWTAASFIFTEIVSAITMLLLARLVGPKSFGLVALAGIAIAALQLLTGFGFGAALIQKINAKEEHLSSVFWTNIGVSFLFALLVSILSPQYARWVHEPALTPILIALAATLPLGGLSVVQEALLTKSLSFRVLAFRSAVSAVVGGTLGIGLAFSGAGAWSLVLQQLARDICRTVLLWRKSPWRPTFTFRISAVREVSGFAAKAAVGDIGAFIQNNFDGVIVGGYVGSASLGLYRLADRLVELCLRLLPRALQTVSLAHFSRVQKDLPAMRGIFMFGLGINALAAFPCMALLAGAGDLILQVFGDQWRSAAGVLSIMCIIGAAKALLLFAAPVLQALYRPGLVSLVTLAAAVGNIFAVLISIHFFRNPDGQASVLCIAGARSLLFCIALVPALIGCALTIMHARIRDAALAISPALLAGAVIYGIARALGSEHLWSAPTPVRLTGICALSLIILTVTVRVLRRDVWDALLNDILLFHRNWATRSSPQCNEARSCMDGVEPGIPPADVAVCEIRLQGRFAGDGRPNP